MVANGVVLGEKSALLCKQRGRMRQKDAVCREQGYLGAGACAGGDLFGLRCCDVQDGEGEVDI